MKKILGLDLGTNSIGWGIVEKNEDHYSLLDKGVVIFPEGVKNEKGAEKSRAAERTGYRSARRLKFRRKLRKYETLVALANAAMCPLALSEVKAWKDSGFKQYPDNPEFLKWLQAGGATEINPYYLRDKASRQKVTPWEAGRALYHLAQRRGFWSNRLDKSDEGIIEMHQSTLESIFLSSENAQELMNALEDWANSMELLNRKSKELDEGEKKLRTLYNAFAKLIKANGDNSYESIVQQLTERINKKENQGIVKNEINELSELMKNAACETLGQYFYHLYKRHQHDPEKQIRRWHTSREEHYVAEFEKICQVQAWSSINKAAKLPEERYTGLVKTFYKAIFYQRPLKSQKGAIGKCVFEPGKQRCPVSHPEYEHYRMWSFLNNIKVQRIGEEGMTPLTPSEKEILIPKFFLRSKPQFNFEELAKILTPKGMTYAYHKSKEAQNAHWLFNYSMKTNVSGNPVAATFQFLLGENWKTKIYEYQVAGKDDQPHTKSVNYQDIWHILFHFDSDERLYRYAKNKLQLTEKNARLFSKIRLKRDYAQLSLKAIRKIVPWLEEGCIYSHAVFMANLAQVLSEKVWGNELNRQAITREIAAIMNTHQEDNKMARAVNDLLKTARDHEEVYSPVAEDYFYKDVEKKLQAIYGKKTWAALPEQAAIKEITGTLFIQQLQKNQGKGQFLPIPRLDEKIKDHLVSNYGATEDTLKKLYHPSDMSAFQPENGQTIDGKSILCLGNPAIPALKNPMALRMLHQLKKLVNHLLIQEKIDNNTQVHIELVRELNDANLRAAIRNWQNEKEALRKDHRKAIKELMKKEKGVNYEPTDDDLLRYQLWEEQNRKEIYEPAGNSIGIGDIIGPNPKYDIEHTIPLSRSYDDSQMNKTLCSIRFNRHVKKDRMPTELTHEVYQDILPRIAHWKLACEELDEKLSALSRVSKQAATKEQKDRIIQARHKLRMQRDYLKGKYNRFLMDDVPEGFKHSQLVDTGIITKYALAFLKPVFGQVRAYKGTLTAEFRKVWGLQEVEHNGHEQPKDLPKDRSKHIHHTIDAIVLACISKASYELMAHRWRLQEQGKKQEARELMTNAKPWPGFAQDLKKLDQEVPVVHHAIDRIKIQTKKKLRKRGKVQYKDKQHQQPTYMQGDTARGSLHKDTFYGVILYNGKRHFVIRKAIEALKKSEIEQIVDEEVKTIVKNAIAKGELIISANDQQRNKIQNGVLWRNQAKGIAIKKVRLFFKGEPIPIKTYPNWTRSRKAHKQNKYAWNDENYCLAIYEGPDKNGKFKRAYEIVNMLDAASYYKSSNRENARQNPLVRESKKGLQLMGILTKGKMVLFYRDALEELWQMPQKQLCKRLYVVKKFSKDGRAMFQFHQEARNNDQMTEDYIKQHGTNPPKSLTNGISYIDFEEPAPRLLLSTGSMNVAIKGLHFDIAPDGQITKLGKHDQTNPVL